MEKANVKLVQKDWTFIDSHVKKITDKDESKFDRLFAYFNQPIKNRLDRHIYLTRAIIYWMYCCESKEIWPEKMPVVSPLALMKRVKDRKLSRQNAFTTICTRADLECKTITGTAKGAGFEPGQRDLSKFRTTWNKVKLEGFWWPVLPIMQSVAKDGHGVVRTLTDFWFLTDPEIFIYKCYPDNIEDQMLPESKQIKNVRKFTKLPHLSYSFFKHNLNLTSEKSSVLDTEDGKCVVSFKADSALAKTLNFQSKLILPANNDQYDETRLIFNSRRKGQFFFEVRCPMLGVFKLEIRGGPINEQPTLYLIAKIECLEVCDKVDQLPIDAGVAAWGFGPVAETVGLSKPSQRDPKIVVTLQRNDPNSNTVKLGFTLDKQKAKSKRFSAQLVMNRYGDDQFEDDVQLTQTPDGLEVEAQLHRTGEYALSILVSDDTGGSTRPVRVCNYLISALEDLESAPEEYEDSSDGFSDIDDENFTLEQRIAELEAKYNELVMRFSSSLSLNKIQ